MAKKNAKTTPATPRTKLTIEVKNEELTIAFGDATVSFTAKDREDRGIWSIARETANALYGPRPTRNDPKTGNLYARLRKALDAK